jgi:hypothetical protein
MDFKTLKAKAKFGMRSGGAAARRAERIRAIA